MKVTTPISPLPHTLRFALFVCDTPAPSIVSEHGDYPTLFKQVFLEALERSELFRQSKLLEDLSISWDYYDVRHSMQLPSDQDSYDAIVITGSAANAYDQDEWIANLVSYIRRRWVNETATSSNLPYLLGICFGHQLIARAFGAEVGKNPKGWEMGCTDLQLTEEGSHFFKQRKELKLQQMHQDEVKSLPNGFQLLASSQKCGIQGMLLPDKILSLQGHPEYTNPLVKSFATLRLSRGIINDQFYQEVLSRNNLVDEGVEVVAVFLEWVTKKFRSELY